jgi:hypothetical protein
MEVLIWLAATYGICFGIMNDKAKFVTDLMRAIPLMRDDEGVTFFDRMFACSYCTGAHCGWIVWLLSWAATNEPPAQSWHAAASICLWMISAASWCYLADSMSRLMEGHTPVEGD